MLLIVVIASNPCGIASAPSAIGSPSLYISWKCISSSCLRITLVKPANLVKQSNWC